MKTTILLLAATSMLASCGLFSNKPLEKGTPIENTKAAADAKMADKANIGKRFSVTGYLYYSPSLTVYTSRPQTVYLYASPNGEGENILAVAMSWSEGGKNTVFLPGDDRDKTKVIFYDNDGKPHGMKDKVILSFEKEESQVYFQNPRIDVSP